ncbi:MAG: hypothetical protein ACRC53_00125 [Plesiomonas sp.]|uniref:hypothetical protein n=1 Tax=Plesiomonas sp. TaxID=2486279 RepID=UPI003F399EB2
MTGNASTKLSEMEMKSVSTLVSRFPWNVARPIISALGFQGGKGKEATQEKIVEGLVKLKAINKTKFDTNVSKINDLILGQIIYGDKALFSFSVDAAIINKTLNSILNKWAATTKPTVISQIIMTDKEVDAAKKNNLTLSYCADDSNQCLVIFSSVREQKIREKLLPSSVPGYSDYDEIVATKKEKRQCFDVCIFDKTNARIHLLVDAINGIVSENVLFTKSSVIRELYDFYGNQFSVKEKDFFNLIEPIFEQNKPPFTTASYKVFDLSFVTPEGTTHKEKKNDPSMDLRNDIFNKEGIKAVGNIGLYRIGIRVEREDASLNLDDNVELVIPGSLRRYNAGSSGDAVNYAILSKCISRKDFEALTKLIL